MALRVYEEGSASRKFGTEACKRRTRATAAGGVMADGPLRFLVAWAGLWGSGGFGSQSLGIMARS
jgi:hypothetical protein